MHTYTHAHTAWHMCESQRTNFGVGFFFHFVEAGALSENLMFLYPRQTYTHTDPASQHPTQNFQSHEHTPTSQKEAPK